MSFSPVVPVFFFAKFSYVKKLLHPNVYIRLKYKEHLWSYSHVTKLKSGVKKLRMNFKNIDHAFYENVS